MFMFFQSKLSFLPVRGAGHRFLRLIIADPAGIEQLFKAPQRAI